MAAGFYRSKDQSTEGESTKEKNTNNAENIIHTEIRNSTVHAIKTRIYNTASHLVYNNMGWLRVGTVPAEGKFARPERQWGCRRGTHF